MNLMKMMKQAQELQGRMQQMQEELASLQVEGQSGGGLVKVTLNGKMEARAVKIDPSLMKPEDAEMLEDLILAALPGRQGQGGGRRAGQDAGGHRRPAPAARSQAVLGRVPSSRLLQHGERAG